MSEHRNHMTAQGHADIAASPLPYQPISCEFHDVLEGLASLRKPAQIVFQDAAGQQQSRHARILDVYARDGAEFLLMADNERVRLDQLIEVDGERLADYESSVCAIQA